MRKLLIIGLLLVYVTSVAQTPVEFLHPIPASYDASKASVPQFASILPSMKLPKGKIYHKTPTRAGWNTDSIMRAGVTHWDKYSVQDEGGEARFRNDPHLSLREYNAAPQIRHIFNLQKRGESRWLNGIDLSWWPDWPYADEWWRRKADEQFIGARIWVGETMEGQEYCGEGREWELFYERLRARYEEQYQRDKEPYLIAHNYFSRAPGEMTLGYDDRAKQEKLYSTPPDQWPFKTLYQTTLRHTNFVVEAIYPNAPDDSNRSMLAKIMAMELWGKMGLHTGIFSFGQHEWHPGYVSRIEYPDGTFYRKDKMIQDPAHLYSWPFLGLEYGDAYFDWGLAGRVPTDLKRVTYYEPMHRGGDWWIPKGKGFAERTQDFPYYDYKVPGKGISAPNQYVGDLSHFGVWLWNQTGGQVVGGQTAYCEFRVDGGPWFKATANGSDVISAFHEKRGIVRARWKGDKLMLMYLNTYADNRRHQVEIRHPLNPSKTYLGTVSGWGVHATLVQL